MFCSVVRKVSLPAIKTVVQPYLNAVRESGGLREILVEGGAELRAELVLLGRVADTGVRLDLQGTYAGVGDLVQARRNAWQLAGFENSASGLDNQDECVSYAAPRRVGG